eukprot:15327940-Ditylum_brightwellii.AAC.1
MNLFARGLGGYMSDKLNETMGMRGRLLVHTAAEGTSYGIVPYVNPPCTGSIAGIVGAGGNTGAV